MNWRKKLWSPWFIQKHFTVVSHGTSLILYLLMESYVFIRVYTCIVQISLLLVKCLWLKIDARYIRSLSCYIYVILSVTTLPWKEGNYFFTAKNAERLGLYPIRKWPLILIPHSRCATKFTLIPDSWFLSCGNNLSSQLQKWLVHNFSFHLVGWKWI